MRVAANSEDRGLPGLMKICYMKSLANIQPSWEPVTWYLSLPERHIWGFLSAYAVSVCQRSTDMFVCQNFAIQSWQDVTHDVGSAVLCGAHGIGRACSNALSARLQIPLGQPTFPGPETAVAVVKVVGGSIPWVAAWIHVLNAGSKLKRNSGGASWGAYGPFEKFQSTSAGGQGKSPKLKLYVLESSPMVDNAPGAKEVVKLTKVLPILLHPSSP